MEKFSIVNLNQFTWQLNVSLMGGVFAVFSLIYNEYYIYYGLITFAAGLLGHVIYLFSEWIFLGKGTSSKWYFLVHFFNLILVTSWFLALKCFYF